MPWWPRRKQRDENAKKISAKAQKEIIASSTAEKTESKGPPTSGAPRRRSTIAFTGGPAVRDAQYLSTLMAVARADARAYKDLSYQMLEVTEGMRVLDVGCGIGVDLPHLSEIVGATGEVIGLDRNAELAERAKQSLQENGAPQNIQVLCGDAESIPLPDASVDRARTDRAMQHFSDPARALADIWRVLKPGGIVTIVEPDWGMMAIHPGSVEGGDDDGTASRVMTATRQSIAHPLIGRQLHGLFRGLGQDAWEYTRVQVITYGLTDWEMVDPILQISAMVEVLEHDNPDERDALGAWVTSLQEATRNETFFTAVPLFFATGRKAGA